MDQPSTQTPSPEEGKTLVIQADIVTILFLSHDRKLTILTEKVLSSEAQMGEWQYKRLMPPSVAVVSYNEDGTVAPTPPSSLENIGTYIVAVRDTLISEGFFKTTGVKFTEDDITAPKHGLRPVGIHGYRTEIPGTEDKVLAVNVMFFAIDIDDERMIRLCESLKKDLSAEEASNIVQMNPDVLKGKKTVIADITNMQSEYLGVQVLEGIEVLIAAADTGVVCLTGYEFPENSRWNKDTETKESKTGDATEKDNTEKE